MKDILVIDDEPDVADLLRINLRTRGQFTVSSVTDGAIGLQKAREESPALIVLDLMLPRMSGFEVCKVLKADPVTQPIPVVVLSAKVEMADRIRGFELGADDYVTKPFSPRELTLRIKSLVQSKKQYIAEPQELTAGAIVVSGTHHEVMVSGRRVSLTGIEFKLLTHLIQTRGRVQPRDLLLQHVWDYGSSMTTRTVDVHVQRLRRKLGTAGEVIETVRTYGYRFRDSSS